MTLNINALNKSFNETTNSYKYLFFLSILELLKDKNFESNSLSFFELEKMMIALSWAPIKVFKLSFGPQDQIYKYIENSRLDLKSNLAIYKKITHKIDTKSTNILRDVPQRLIRPFFYQETKGLKDHLVNRKIVNLSNEFFNSASPPLYRIDDEKELIEIPKEWITYLKTNFICIYGWVNFEWGNYLQKNNQNTPGILNKLALPSKRASLNFERKLWRALIDRRKIKCIYSNLQLENKFDLDHFLPWSFIAHNQLWNLIPVSSKVNLEKTNHIPSMEYIKPLSMNHFELITTVRNDFDHNTWVKFINSYIDGVGLEFTEDVITYDSLESAFTKIYTPLIQIAENIGFKANWKYSS